jgi:hypothetical protein
MGTNINGPTIRISPPRLPPVVIPTPVPQSTSIAAVLDSVDNPANPTIASFIINGSLPAVSGFVWNTALAVTVTMAPNPAAAPPTGTVYYNNSTTMDGGTIFYIDTLSRTIVSATSNFSTVAGINYSTLFQDISHNGAYNPTGGFQNPNPLDVSSLLGNPNPTQAPILVPPLPASYGFAYVGANGVISTGGAYDAQFEFNTLVTNPGWLQELRIYVAATGTQVDNVANIDHTFAYKTTLSPSSTGNYIAWVHGLVAGVPYDVYVAFVDLKGVVSYGRYLETTASNPIQIQVNGLPSMGNASLVTPIVISHGTDIAEDGTAGATAFDYLVPTVLLDPNGYSTNPWILEIELVYINTQKTANVMYANTVTVQSSGTYSFVYPQLPVGTNSDGSQIVYQLGVRYVDFQGQRSNILLFDQVGSSTLQVGSPTLQTIPNGTTFYVDFIGLTEPAPTNNGGGTFAQNLSFNLHITSSVPFNQWLDKIQLLAKEQPNGIADSDTNPQDYVKVGQITGSTYTNPVNQSFGPLGNNSIWQLAIQLVDHSGIFTQALPIFLCGFQTVNPVLIPSNANLIPDSDMLYTQLFANVNLSSYWTYAGADPTRFRVTTATAAGNMLDADTHGTQNNVGPVCAYTEPIAVTAGQAYVLSAMTGLFFDGSGTQNMGIVNVSDKTANNTTPTSIYAQVSCPNNTGVQSLTSVTWTSTITGNVVMAFWANNIHGTCAWFQPQFEQGSTVTAYTSGIAVQAGTIAHTAQSIAVQAAVDSTGAINVSNPQAGSVLPLTNNSSQVSDVITAGTTGRGTVNVAPAGGTNGNLPYVNHSTAIQAVITSAGGVNVSPTGGTNGNLPYVNQSGTVQNAITSTSGALSAYVFVIGSVSPTLSAGDNTIVSGTTASIVIPSGGVWAVTASISGPGWGLTALGPTFGSGTFTSVSYSSGDAEPFSGQGSSVIGTLIGIASGGQTLSLPMVVYADSGSSALGASNWFIQAVRFQN